MRKLLALLVVLILPLQVTFAVAAEYCEVENNDTGRHFGHHAHSADLSKKESPSKKGKADSDCAFCHLGCAQLQVSTIPVAQLPAPEVFTVHEVTIPLGVSPPSFDRPPKHPRA